MTERVDRRMRDFATVCAGYLAGHGVLRLFAGILTGLGDAPRADLLWRWLPAWNALGWFIGAWGAYHLVLWARQWAGVGLIGPGGSTDSSAASLPDASAPSGLDRQRPSRKSAANAGPPPDWKKRLKALQKKKDVDGILDLQQEMAQTLPKERAEQLDRRLGRWFTKHFQHVMLSGRAAESLADVERVAAHYARMEEFAYFQEILPVVRQCAELKQSLQEEE